MKRQPGIILTLIAMSVLARAESPVDSLTIGDFTYERVTLSQFKDNQITFTHAIGNKTVPLTVLTREQVAALNASTDKSIIEPGDVDLTPPSREAVQQAEKMIRTAGDVNGLLPGGNTPLIEAAANGWDDIAKALIARDADLNLKNGLEQTALMVASAKGRVKVCRLLKDSGVKVTDLKTAMLIEDVKTIRELVLKNKNLLKTVDVTGMSPLMRAAASGQPAIIEALIGAGASTKEQDPATGATPLMVAAAAGREEAMKTLISRGALLDEEDKAGWTPLMHAAAAGQTNAVALLLGKGAKMSAGSGGSAVDVARQKGQPGVVGILERAEQSAREAALAAAAKASNAAAAKISKPRAKAPKPAVTGPAQPAVSSAAAKEPPKKSSGNVFAQDGTKIPDISRGLYILILAGFITYLTGSIWMVVLAWKESIGWAIAMFLFNPLPNVIYFFMHKRETWIPFALMWAGAASIAVAFSMTGIHF